MIRRRLFAVLTAVALSAVPALAQDDGLGLAVGSTVPTSGLVVESLDGKPLDLAQRLGRGRPVLLQFWATWCGNCKQLEPQLRQIAQQYGAKVAMVGVAVSVNQSAERVRRYQAAHKLPVEIVYDRKGAAADAFEALATSYVVVLDAKGKVVYTGQGGDQNLVAAVKKAL